MTTDTATAAGAAPAPLPLLVLGHGTDLHTERGVECPGELPSPSDPDLVERARAAKAALGDRVFVLGQIDAEGLVVDDKRFDPLHFSGQLFQRGVGDRGGFFELLAIEPANAGQFALDHIPFHGIFPPFRFRCSQDGRDRRPETDGTSDNVAG